MRILAINCGSSTLKFQVIEVGREEKTVGRELRVVSGTLKQIGGLCTLDSTIGPGFIATTVAT